MAQYKTGQRTELVAYLKSRPDERFSAKQLSENLSGGSISLSAVYRNLASLEKDGVITRSVKDGSREIFYQYIDNAICKNCIHLTCIKCGKTFHLNCAVAEEIISSVKNSDGFAVSRAKTVLYGLCSDCA